MALSLGIFFSICSNIVKGGGGLEQHSRMAEIITVEQLVRFHVAVTIAARNTDVFDVRQA